ncbi:MAG: DNA polymerase III subunit beta [Dehalococcoidia bacterium]
MRATTQRMALLETLGKVKSAVPGKHLLPVCTSVLIRAGGGEVTLVGTDLDVMLTASCKATVTRQGAVAVPPRALEAFLKGTKADTVALSLVNKKFLKIEAEATTTLEGFEAENFPPALGVEGKAAEVTGLASALKGISYAMAKEDVSRPVLTGVCFTPDKGRIALAASDGFRLAETSVKVKGQLAQTIVPGKAVQLIEKLMPGKVSIHRDEKYISFIGDGLVLTTMFTYGTYPNYKQVIPKNGSPLTVDSAALKDALSLAAITLPDNNAVRLRTKGSNLVVSTKNDEKGETEAKVPAKGRVKIAFDARYFKDVLARASGPITLRTKNAQSPGVVKQNGTVHVLMPMHVEW